MEENCDLANYDARLPLDFLIGSHKIYVLIGGPKHAAERTRWRQRRSIRVGIWHGVVRACRQRWACPMTFEKHPLWRRQQELRLAKVHIDTSCLEIGTMAFR